MADVWTYLVCFVFFYSDFRWLWIRAHGQNWEAFQMVLFNKKHEGHHPWLMKKKKTWIEFYYHISRSIFFWILHCWYFFSNKVIFFRVKRGAPPSLTSGGNMMPSSNHYCGGDFTDLSGILRSPGYPLYYPNNKV